MITKQDTNNAAQNYEHSLTYSKASEQYDVQKAFKAGANWRINTVWHDVSERPVSMKECLVELDDPMRKGWHIGRIENEGTNKGKWNIYGYFTPSLHECIIRWAYLSDFIPNKEA